MIYLYTSADGKNTEGIGAMAQYQIHTYTLQERWVLSLLVKTLPTFSTIKNTQHRSSSIWIAPNF